jgi:hypothetical protein
MKNKEKDLEKFLCPKVGKLIKKKESVTAKILDAELDELDLTFDYSKSVKIDTENLTYITLDYNNLYDLIDLIDNSERYFHKRFNKDK